MITLLDQADLRITSPMELFNTIPFVDPLSPWPIHFSSHPMHLLDFKQDNSPTWPYDAQVEEPASLFYQLPCGDDLNRHDYANANPLDIFETHSEQYPGWNPSPSASPCSSSSPMSSGPEESMTCDFAVSRSPFLPFGCNSRSTSGSPLDRLSYNHSRPFFPEPDPPIVHETYEVETGEDEVVKAFIHRLTDEEKRFIDFSSASSRPTFCCHFRGCGKWLYHRAQIKPHLSEHGYRFCKPYKCTCGADFGRQVEAARHVEDKKLCEQCHRSGRKYKGGTVCLRCLRRFAGK